MFEKITVGGNDIGFIPDSVTINLGVGRMDDPAASWHLFVIIKQMNKNIGHVKFDVPLNDEMRQRVQELRKKGRFKILNPFYVGLRESKRRQIVVVKLKDSDHPIVMKGATLVDVTISNVMSLIFSGEVIEKII